MKSFILGVFIIGVFIGGRFCTPYALWNPEDDGLWKVHDAMKKDKTPRLALVILTHNGLYSTSVLGDGYELQARVVKT